MKAKEYIAKYKEPLESEDCNLVKEAGFKMILELFYEAKDLIESRGVKRDSSVVAVLKEQNDKWNAIARAFPGILARDGFKRMLVEKFMPDLKSVWR